MKRSGRAKSRAPEETTSICVGHCESDNKQLLGGVHCNEKLAPVSFAALFITSIPLSGIFAIFPALILLLCLWAHLARKHQRSKENSLHFLFRKQNAECKMKMRKVMTGDKAAEQSDAFPFESSFQRNVLIIIACILIAIPFPLALWLFTLFSLATARNSSLKSIFCVWKSLNFLKKT